MNPVSYIFAAITAAGAFHFMVEPVLTDVEGIFLRVAAILAGAS